MLVLDGVLFAAKSYQNTHGLYIIKDLTCYFDHALDCSAYGEFLFHLTCMMGVGAIPCGYEMFLLGRAPCSES